ncbi:hypothetical protein Poli38472_012880 [Pythium oligandrum]|uniref:Uncharacterized protein n=1 Tax=Pythium oligandrum TaxID=41045 RepID=A0A8K1FN36_PYTOL|nr:hypothetical protein Poli38472_012880 [Pythium oligandrum]|eukprot:TMW64258.1 hypothetical protein Poli38472_012880 [Pythium oligandrum]
MGKRKAPLPRRRIGAQYALDDVSSRKSVHARTVIRTGNATSAAPVLKTARKKVLPLSSSEHDTSSLPLNEAEEMDDDPPRQSTGKKRREKLVMSPLNVLQTPVTASLIKKDRSAATIPFLGKARAKRQDDEDDQESITVTIKELETWKKETILQIEDHFTNEQLKRIAEFGRVHANLVKEAKDHVFSVETQLKEHLEQERESLRSQAEEYVAQFQKENTELQEQVTVLQQENEELKRQLQAVRSMNTRLSQDELPVRSISELSFSTQPVLSPAPLHNEPAESTDHASSSPLTTTSSVATMTTTTTSTTATTLTIDSLLPPAPSLTNELS